MKVVIDVDEKYPNFYICETPTGREVDIPSDKMIWIRDTEEEYVKVQKYLRDLYGWVN